MTPLKLMTAALCTARKNPQWKWFADSFARALEHCPLPVECIVVDKLLWDDSISDGYVTVSYARRRDLSLAVAGRFPYTHVPPKPSPWQGPWRKTPRDHFALCGARNTALALARGEYVCFFDDCTILDERYLRCHALGAARGLATAGSFKCWDTAVVTDGRILEGVPSVKGSEDGRGTTLLVASGGWFYGLNCGAPLSAFLAINGYDERFDGQGGSEDCSAGVCIDRAGYKVVFTPQCLVHQVLESHEPVCEYETWGKPQPRKQKERVLEADGIPHFANEFLIQELLKDPKWIRSPNEFDLGELRQKVQARGFEAFSTEFAIETDWRDGAPLPSCL